MTLTTATPIERARASVKTKESALIRLLLAEGSINRMDAISAMTREELEAAYVQMYLGVTLRPRCTNGHYHATQFDVNVCEHGRPTLTSAQSTRREEAENASG